MEVLEMAPEQGNPAAENAQKPPPFSGGGGVCSSILSLIITAFATTLEKLKSLVKLNESENAILQNLERQELSKAIYQVGVTLTAGLVALRRDKLEAVEQLMVVANAMGCGLIFNGLMLRESTPTTFARIAELVGVGIVFASIHLMFSIHLVWWLRIVLAVCCVFCIRPLIMAEIAANEDEEG